MTTLHFDFEKDARRQSIVAQLRAALGDERADEAFARAESAGVPDRHHHNLAEILETIDAIDASERVKDDMRAIYTILTEAEAHAHGCSVSEAHFHEVGEGKRIRNTLGVCLAIEQLAPGSITATCVQPGSGTVMCAHGEMNVPTPATADILSRGIPTSDTLLEGELCTPTSAAIICHFVDEFTA